MICDVAPAPPQPAVKSPGSLSPSSPGATRIRGSVRWDTGKENEKLPVRTAGDEEIIVDTFRKVGKDTRARAPLSHQSVLEATTESYRTRRDGRKPGGTVTSGGTSGTTGTNGISGTSGTAHSGEQTEGPVSSLFLTLTGQVHSSESYRSLFGESESHFLIGDASAVSTESPVPGPQDREVVGQVLGDILREAFRDPDVRTACEAGPIDGPSHSADVPTWASRKRRIAGEVNADREEVTGSLPEVSAALEEGRDSGEPASDGYSAGMPMESSGEAAEERIGFSQVNVGPGGFDGEVSTSAGDVVLPKRGPDESAKVTERSEAGRSAEAGVDQAADLKRLAEFVLEGTLFSVVKDALRDKERL